MGLQRIVMGLAGLLRIEMGLTGLLHCDGVGG